MKKIVTLLVLFLSLAGFAQNEVINNYKYVIMPEQFSFFKEPNKYNLNELTKKIFEKQGFIVFYPNDNMPQDLSANKCTALYGDLINDSGVLTTGLSIVLRDCSGKVLYTSEKGRSKEKDFQKGYYEALRKASILMGTNLNYHYAGDGALAGTSKAVAVPATPAAPVVQAAAQIPASSNPADATAPSTVLFAQPIANGYQLVDSTPKVVLKIYKTSQTDSYTAQAEGKNGLVFKKGNDWYFEYYQNDKPVSEKLNIKF